MTREVRRLLVAIALVLSAIIGIGWWSFTHQGSRCPANDSSCRGAP